MPLQRHDRAHPAGVFRAHPLSTAFGSISTPKGVQPGFGQVVCVVGDGLQVQMEIRCLFGQVNLLD